jgi:hypothetical protein
MAGVPGNGQALDDVDDPKKHDTKKRQKDERGEHKRQIEIADGPLKDIADTVVRTDEFADHGTDNA